MKLKTHYVFSTGLISLVIALLFKISFYDDFVISILVSFLGNTIIDRLGHKEVVTRFGELPVRTPLTHTFPRSVIWGLISTLPLFFSSYYLYHYGYYYSYDYYHSLFNVYTLALLIAGIIVGPSHMLLDVFTEKGIYVKKNGKWKRFALVHYKYDNPLVNGLAIAIGAVMLYVAYSL
ncbi:MAG: DUF1286 domain-containing protein [Sulfolobus sp.]|nr:DUF1286 domain-containing protein [Sulfolobus sp.]